jgi:NADPH-dependent dioxygenase
MNTGIQEAFNLAWKLEMVIHGEAGEALLDTYSAERVPIGAELLDSTKNATALVALKSRFAAALLPIVFGIVQRIPALKVRGQRKALGRVAGLNIGYPDGPLTRPAAPGPGPRPGDRVVQVGPEAATAPGWAALVRQLREPGWTLVVFGESNRAAAERARWPWLTVRVAGDAELPDPDGRLATGLGVTGAGWLLIRPDGYVAARGTELTDAELTAAFAPLALPAAERTLQ